MKNALEMKQSGQQTIRKCSNNIDHEAIWTTNCQKMHETCIENEAIWTTK